MLIVILINSDRLCKQLALFQEPFGSWTSAPTNAEVRTKKRAFLRPGDGEKMFDPMRIQAQGSGTSTGNPD